MQIAIVLMLATLLLCVAHGSNDVGIVSHVTEYETVNSPLSIGDSVSFLLPASVMQEVHGTVMQSKDLDSGYHLSGSVFAASKTEDSTPLGSFQMIISKKDYTRFATLDLATEQAHYELNVAHRAANSTRYKMSKMKYAMFEEMEKNSADADDDSVVTAGQVGGIGKALQEVDALAPSDYSGAGPHYLDLMLIFTADVMVAKGGQAEMDSICMLLTSNLNTALAESGVPLIANQVRLIPITYHQT